MASTLQQPLVIRDMPSYMNFVLQSIVEKHITCSFCHQFLLSFTGKLEERQDICAVESERFSMEWSAKSFAIHCIYAVYHAYICRALAMIDEQLDQLPLSRDVYIKMFDDCKEMALQRALFVWESEQYLENISFGDELRRSFDDFLMRIRTEFGFWPYMIGGECPALSLL
jgi:hypothetical protein